MQQPPTQPLISHRKSLNSLTSLRFVASLCIVIYHAKSQFPFLVDITKEFELSQGVSFFFVLSGFILTYAHNDLCLVNSKPYLISRFWRIYPVHIFALVTLYALIPGQTLFFRGWQVALAYLTMTHGWIPIERFYFVWNSPSWSISTEWFFYICLPALLMTSRKRIFFPVMITLLSLVGTCMLAGYSKLPLSSAEGVSSHGLLYINPLARMFEFALGILVALTREKIPNSRLPTLSELSALTLMVAVCHVSTKLTILNTIKIPEHLIFWVSHCGLSAFSSALLILCFQQERGFVSKILKFKPLVLLGELSFAIYMLHEVFLRYIYFCLPLNNTLADFCIFLMVLVSASFFVFSFIETPARKLFKPGGWKMYMKRETITLTSISNLARLVGSAAIGLAIIYYILPGVNLYKGEIPGTAIIPTETVNFDNRVEIFALHEGHNTVYCRFRARKRILLFERVEFQLLDEDLHSKMLLRQCLTAKPEAIAEGTVFDIKIPVSNELVKNSAFISLKLMRHNGKPLYPQSGTRDDNGTRLLINVGANLRAESQN